jgi:hypothetical protein
MRLCLLLLVLPLSQTARAQDEAPSMGVSAPPLIGADAPPVPSAPDAPAGPPILLSPGDKLLVHLPEGVRYSGTLLSLMPDELSLELRTRQVVRLRVTDVERLELAHRPWLKTGLAGGGIGGLAGFLLTGAVCGLASTEGPVDVASCAGSGALVGASIGAGVGVLVGLATSSWSTLYEKRKDGPLSLRLEDPNVLSRFTFGEGRRGELGLQLGYARDVGIPQPTDGWGGRLHVLLLLGPYFAIGPELAVYKDVGDETVVQPIGPAFRNERNLVQFQGLVRGGVQVGLARFALLGALGVHSNRNSHFGGSFGAEVELRLWERLPPLTFETRYHLNLDKHGTVPRQDFVTMGVGSRVRW